MSEYGVVTGPGTMRFERLLPGPIERVWRYLTDSDKRSTWLASGEMERRVGGRVKYVFRNSELTEDDDPAPPKHAAEAGEVRMQGRVTAYEPPFLLAHTWPESSGEESEVTFELETRGDKVLLVVTHRRIWTRSEMVSVAGGWHTHLGILASRLSGETPAGFWATFTRTEAEYEHRIPAETTAPEAG